MMMLLGIFATSVRIDHLFARMNMLLDLFAARERGDSFARAD